MLYLSKVCYNKQPSIEHLMIPALFHDIAYPLQEQAALVNIVSSVMSENFASFSKASFNSHFKDVTEIGRFFSKIYEQIRRGKLFSTSHESLIIGELTTSLLSNNHAFLSAFELWNVVKDSHKNEDYILKSLLAIALHDSTLHFAGNFAQVDDSLFPQLFLLILADELQEWNRPIREGHNYIVPVSQLEISYYNSTVDILCRYEIDNYASFNPLFQMASKNDSLKRLKSSRNWRLNFANFDYHLASHGHAILGLSANMPSVCFTHLPKENLTISLTEVSSDAYIQFCFTESTSKNISTIFKNNQRCVRNESIFLLDIDPMIIRDYMKGALALYKEPNNKDVMLFMSKDPDVIWPNKLSTFTFKIGDIGMNGFIEDLEFGAIHIIPAETSLVLLKNTTESETRTVGAITFVKNLYKCKGIPFFNLFLVTRLS
jgi:hypothetical protein